jgi:hypothetical protein
MKANLCKSTSKCLGLMLPKRYQSTPIIIANCSQWTARLPTQMPRMVLQSHSKSNKQTTWGKSATCVKQIFHSHHCPTREREHCAAQMKIYANTFAETGRWCFKKTPLLGFWNKMLQLLTLRSSSKVNASADFRENQPCSSPERLFSSHL